MIMKDTSQHDCHLCDGYVNALGGHASGQQAIAEDGIYACDPKSETLSLSQTMLASEPLLKAMEANLHQGYAMFQTVIFKPLIRHDHTQVFCRAVNRNVNRIRPRYINFEAAGRSVTAHKGSACSSALSPLQFKNDHRFGRVDGQIIVIQDSKQGTNAILSHAQIIKARNGGPNVDIISVNRDMFLNPIEWHICREILQHDTDKKIQSPGAALQPWRTPQPVSIG